MPDSTPLQSTTLLSTTPWRAPTPMIGEQWLLPRFLTPLPIAQQMAPLLTGFKATVKVVQSTQISHVSDGGPTPSSVSSPLFSSPVAPSSDGMSARHFLSDLPSAVLAELSVTRSHTSNSALLWHSFQQKFLTSHQPTQNPHPHLYLHTALALSLAHSL